MKETFRCKISFYDTFICTADRCPYNCCREWKIGVDKSTAGKWAKVTSPLDPSGKLKDHTCTKEGEQVIRLNPDQVCPFQEESGLCRLVISCGEEMLSKTCREFPREIHHFSTRTEYTLMPSCPAVIDSFMGWSNGEILSEGECPKKESFLFDVRDRLIRMMRDESHSVSQTLLCGFYVLLQMLEGETDRWDGSCDSLVKELYRQLPKMETDSFATMQESTELILDLAQNYRNQRLYLQVLEPLCERAEEFLDSAEMPDIRCLEQYEHLFRAYLCEEFFEDLVQEKGTLENMVIRYQWILLVFAAIRQAILLCAESETIDYETVRMIFVIFSRMTGYEEEDIYEYLDDCFESRIWDWGYGALIAGEV